MCLQILVVPTAFRSRDRLEAILGLDESSQDSASRTDPIAEATLKDLKNIYEHTIKPMEMLYNYQDISNRHVSDAELFGKPLVLLVGPYSTGKSSFINYLLGVEYTKRALKTGQYQQAVLVRFLSLHANYWLPLLCGK